MEENNWGILKQLEKKSNKIIRWYIDRLQIADTNYVRYQDAVDAVNAMKGEKMKKRMLYLLRKTSDSETLTAALEKLRKKYGLSRNQCRNVLKKFKKLGISPITLTNSSKYDSLPPIDSLI